MAEVLLEIPARPDYLALARQVVAAAAALEPTFRDERIDDLRIAVSEATTNAIEAHSDLSRAERIVIRCNLDDDRIEVEVVDQGLGFDEDDLVALPEATAPDRLEYERGLGIPLMRVLADEADITSDEEGTAVRLVVYTPAHRRATQAGDQD
ncbi:MAG: ATP-binding protein [Actinobacteria bacterium]|nr:ATP-binding protein [Actinomycetota bacterium]